MGPFATDDILTASRRCRLPGPVAIDKRATKWSAPLKKGLHRPRLSAIIPNLTAAGSHLDCRVLIAAPFSSRLSRYKRLFEDATIYAGAVGCVLANRLSEAQSHSSMGQTKIVRYADSADRFSIIPL